MSARRKRARRGRVPHTGTPAMIVLVCAGLALTSCHQFTNPVDPNSTTFEGGTSTGDPDASESGFPPVVSWQIFAEHAPGQFLALEIPDDDSFVEPRVPADPEGIRIVVTFDSPLTEQILQDALFYRSIDNGGGPFLELYWPHDWSEDRRSLIWYEVPPPPGNAVSVRIAIFDANGDEVTSRGFGVLPGDFNGDGVVDMVDYDAVNNPPASGYAGLLASQSNIPTIRGDMDADGVVKGFELGLGNDDTEIPNDYAGTTLPPIPPEF